jgi:hypothetical protein
MGRKLLRYGLIMAVCGLAGSVCVMTSKRDAPPPPVKGMVAIGAHIYTEPGLTDAEVAELRRDWEIARQNLVRAFDGETRSMPLTLFCHTASCKVELGASPDVAAANDLGFASTVLPGSSVVATGPVSGTARILTHEFVHAEMKEWTSYDSLPTWFNEGMATFVANEPSCARNPPAPLPDIEPLTTKDAWQRHLREHHDTIEVYCQSRHRVAAWAERFGDEKGRAAALKTLLTSVAHGTPFDRAP